MPISIAVGAANNGNLHDWPRQARCAALWLLSATVGCVGMPMETRRASAGVVRTLADKQPVAGAEVAIQTSRQEYHGCQTKVIDEYEVTTDARGRWFVPSHYSMSWIWLAPHGVPAYCQRYRLKHHADVPTLGPLEADHHIETAQSRTLQLKVQEFPSEPPYVHLIAGISGSTDQGGSLHLGTVVLFEQRWLDLGMRAALEPGLWGGAALLGLRGGHILQVDVSAKLLRVWGRGESGTRVGPALGLDLFMLRLSGGALRRVEGTLDGPEWIGFVAAGWNVVL